MGGRSDPDEGVQEVWQRLAWAVPTAGLVLLAVFSLRHLTPGDPARLVAPLETVEAVRHALGLDRPVVEQFTQYASRLVHPDWPLDPLEAPGARRGPGPRPLNMMVAVGIYTVPSFARVTRAATLRTKALLYVEAATSLGSNSARVMWRHILPNVVSPVIVLSSLRIATAILTASSLSFLGLGIQPPSPEWGAMLSDGRNYLRSAPHVAAIPGMAIMLVVWGFNLLGDGLRDALDPRSKG